MSKKVEKIEKEELDNLQNIIGRLNNLKIELGNIENAKHKMLHQIGEIEAKEFATAQQELEEKYGKVNVNISDGTITKVEDEPSKED
jgi:predicted DNA binding CopG/RHH family protein